MPTEQISTYFHAASIEARVRRCPTRNAVAMVVASIATHRVPRLAASTAVTIAARNACTSRLWRYAVRAVACPARISPSR